MPPAWNGGNNQQWTLNLLSNGNYQIVNRGTGTAGATTVLWTPDSSTNNQWTVIEL